MRNYELLCIRDKARHVPEPITAGTLYKMWEPGDFREWETGFGLSFTENSWLPIDSNVEIPTFTWAVRSSTSRTVRNLRAVSRRSRVLGRLLSPKRLDRLREEVALGSDLVRRPKGLIPLFAFC